MPGPKGMVAPLPSVGSGSLWQATSVARPAFGRLSGDQSFDVAIIGGGYTGLSSARYLSKAGLSPVVIEANCIGWGASGRNGGVVSGKFRIGFKDIAARHGLDTARRMHALGLEAIEHVGQLIEELGIAGAESRPTGSLRCAHNARTLEALRSEAAWLREALGDTDVSMLSAGEVADETGSRGFTGGMLNTHGGVIHPLNFVLGLAAGLKAAGIAIYENTPVTRFGREGTGVVVETPRGRITARQLVIATNAYSDMTPATDMVRTSIIPFRSAMVATEALGGTPGAGLLASGRSYTETRRMMRWFRKSGDRLLYGGRGAFGKTDSRAAFAALEKAMVRQFPELASVKVSHKWSGLVAMTLDSLPHLGRLDDRVVYSIGYNGTGVALASGIGRHVAALVTGGTPDLGLLTRQPLPPIPFYGLREPAVRVVAGWYQFLDAIGR
ncbi:glycine/D-amino acid oxidase-like deaminating enzyme [Ancylobacter aquaticus]|uniref:Glycine/D-amino acid oxidase-like deaminating enzyme n=1 Tax=Ancylobacter aquaticus TaxID=100 RepID=A0A4R1IBI6_ANCAQ|nr:FAD-binding oxidoreductase [Ancylobacter aquaticus]TCK31445.1 glycine/D-amino acid oxidase-like deaminating enzyme [Ancylobacter aquaticus]